MGSEQSAPGRRRSDPRSESAALRRCASGGIPAGRHRARQPGRLPVPGEGRSGSRRGSDRHGRRGLRCRRSRVLDLPGRGRHDLRPRRREASCRGSSDGRRGDGSIHQGPARGAHVLAGRPDELLRGRPDAVRPRAQARRHGARREHPLVDAARVRWRSVHRLRRHELLRAARLRRRRAAPPAPSDVDAQAGEVRADVHCRTRVRGHGADAGGIGAPAGRRSRQRGRCRSSGDLHRSAVAVVRLPGRQRRSGEPRDPRADLGRRGRGRRLERGGSAAGQLERSERDSRAVLALERRHRGRSDGRERGGRGAAGRQLRLRRASPGRRRRDAFRTRSRSRAPS